MKAEPFLAMACPQRALLQTRLARKGQFAKQVQERWQETGVDEHSQVVAGGGSFGLARQMCLHTCCFAEGGVGNRRGQKTAARDF